MEIDIENNLRVKLNQENKTASITKSPNVSGKVFIPRFAEFENQKYKIISISGYAFDKKTIELLEFPEDSEVETLDKYCFANAHIKKLQIPASLKFLKDDWCSDTKDLTEIEVSPKNSLFQYYESQFLLGKSDENQSEYDILYYARYDIEDAAIPPQVKILKRISFFRHPKLTSITFSQESKLKIIEDFVLYTNPIRLLVLPPSIEEIQNNNFYCVSNLKRVEIGKGNKKFMVDKSGFVLSKSDEKSSNFDTLIFSPRNIEKVTIPNHVKLIFYSAFNLCKNIKSLEFEPNSLLEEICYDAFACSSLPSKIVIPEKVKKICRDSFRSIDTIQTLEILGKSVKLESASFYCCSNLSDVSFPNATNIFIDSYSFKNISKDAKIKVRRDAKLSGDGFKENKDLFFYFGEESTNVKFETDEEDETEETDEKIEEEEVTKIDILVNEIFNVPDFIENNINDYHPDEIFIKPEIIKEAVRNKPYEEIIPTIILHLDKSLKEINYDELQINLGKDAVILNVKRTPTIFQIALLSIENFEGNVNEMLDEYVSNLEKKMNVTSEIRIPDDADIREIFSKLSLNSTELGHNEIEHIRKKVVQKLKKNKNQYNWEFLFRYEDLYNQMDAQIQADFEKNQYEMKIVHQTLFANGNMEEYDKIKKQIPQKDVVECFLYHGSIFNNHKRTHNNQLLEEKMMQIEASNNPFYASIYSNGNKVLEVNEKTYIICCKAIYDGSKIKDLNDDKPVDDYGIKQAFVGDSTGFLPINQSEKGRNKIIAQEFAFSNDYQIIPLCLITIERKDNYILWKDEKIKNDANTKILKQLLTTMDVNVYGKDSVDSAVELIKNKKYARVKLITNGGHKNFSGQILIEQARSITHSKFVCLVFATLPTHLEWISKMENVLFTPDQKELMLFSGLNMYSVNDVYAFASQIKNKYDTKQYKFNIKKEELLNFPDRDELEESSFTNRLMKKILNKL